MPLKIEREDEAHVSFPMWKKDFGGRGTVALVRDEKTGDPMLRFQPPHNLGDPAPEPQLYRIVF